MPLFFLPANFNGNITSCDEKLFNVLMKVNVWQKNTKDAWKIAAIETDKGVWGIDEQFIRDINGVTVMPTYSVYCDTWKNAWRVNPLDFKWLNYDKSDTLAHRVIMEYMEAVINVMKEQITIWEVDNNTKGSLLFYCFNEFYMALLELFALG